MPSADTVAAIAACVGIIVTLWLFWLQRFADHDQLLVAQMILSLERAYQALAPDQGAAAPVRSRVAWLTSARHLETYRALKRRLRTKLGRLLADDHEEYWRHRTYILLDGIEHYTYYGHAGCQEVEGETIDPTSAAVILAFSDWPEGRPDPIDAVSFDALVRSAKLFSPKFRHFREYIRRQSPGAYRDLGGPE